MQWHTHIETFSNDSPEVCGARSAALPRLCHFQLNWEQLHTQPTHSRGFPAGPGRWLQHWKSLRPGLGQGKVSGQGGRGHPAILRAAGSATSCKAELESSAYATPRPLSYILIGTSPACRIASKHVILQYMILLLNQDNTTIKNNIIITCSTMNKFCRKPEHCISITDSSISTFCS